MSAWRKGSGGEPGVDVARHENVSHMGRIFVSGWRIRVENRRTPPTCPNGKVGGVSGGRGWARTSRTRKRIPYGMCFVIGGGVGPVVGENKPDTKTRPIWDAFSCLEGDPVGRNKISKFTK